MNTHRLTEADEWFLEKKQIDTLTRKVFSAGDEVVMCDHRHVMLAEFYSGQCSSCGSRKLITFSQENVEQTVSVSRSITCPHCGRNISLILRINETNGRLSGKCPRCKRRFVTTEERCKRQDEIRKKRLVAKTINVSFYILLLSAILTIVLLTLSGVITHQNTISHIREASLACISTLTQSVSLQFPFDLLPLDLSPSPFTEAFSLLIGNSATLFSTVKDAFFSFANTFPYNNWSSLWHNIGERTYTFGLQVLAVFVRLITNTFALIRNALGGTAS